MLPRTKKETEVFFNLNLFPKFLISMRQLHKISLLYITTQGIMYVATRKPPRTETELFPLKQTYLYQNQSVLEIKPRSPSYARRSERHRCLPAYR